MLEKNEKSYLILSFLIPINSPEVPSITVIKSQHSCSLSSTIKMKLSVKSIFLYIFLCSLLSVGFSLEPAKFIVKVGHYTEPNLGTTIIKCSGTIVSSRHVLTTARCVTPIQISQGISVVQNFESNACKFLKIDILKSDNDWHIFLVRNRVEKVSIHPNYVSFQSESFNLAILLVGFEFKSLRKLLKSFNSKAHKSLFKKFLKCPKILKFSHLWMNSDFFFSFYLGRRRIWFVSNCSLFADWSSNKHFMQSCRMARNNHSNKKWFDGLLQLAVLWTIFPWSFLFLLWRDWRQYLRCIHWITSSLWWWWIVFRDFDQGWTLCSVYEWTNCHEISFNLGVSQLDSRSFQNLQRSNYKLCRKHFGVHKTNRQFS